MSTFVCPLSFNIGGDETSGLNEAGDPRVAYHFTLTDGREGIAIWDLNDVTTTIGVPEPVTAALGLLALAGFSRRRHRHRA